MAATKLSLETRADGAGVTIASQSFAAGETLTVYVISRDASNAFVDNAAADSIALQSITDGIDPGDLTVAVDLKSATFTAALAGSAVITAVKAGLTSGSTATLYVYGDFVSCVTLTELKQYLDERTTTNDATLVAFLNLVNSSIELRLNQNIVPKVIEDILDGSGTDILFTKKARIVSLDGGDEATRLSNLQSRDQATSSWTNLLTDESLIIIPDQNSWKIQLLDGNTFPSGKGNIRIQYNGGFSPVPGELKNLVLQKVKVLWDESKGKMLGVVSKNTNEGGATFSTAQKDMNPLWDAVYERWQRLAYE